MKKFLAVLFLIAQFFITTSAISLRDYEEVPYIGENIEDVVNGSLPCVLVIANPKDRASLIKYLPIGKMVYSEFQNQYTFCILNSNTDENEEYIEFLQPTELPAVYIINPEENTYARINKKYHNSKEIRRILNKITDKK